MQFPSRICLHCGLWKLLLVDGGLLGVYDAMHPRPDSLIFVALQTVQGKCQTKHSTRVSFASVQRWHDVEERMQQRDVIQDKKEKDRNLLEERMLMAQRTVHGDWERALATNTRVEQSARACLRGVEQLLMSDGCLSKEVRAPCNPTACSK